MAKRRDCGSVDHRMHRRLFLQGTMAAGAAMTASFNGLFSIPALAEHLVNRICRSERIPVKQLTSAALDLLTVMPWPGNVRQLENALE